MKRFILNSLTALLSIPAFSAEWTNAKIDCVTFDNESNAFATGSIEFFNGLEFYGPAMNKFKGQMRFNFANNIDEPILSSNVTGHQIQPARFEEPIFWNLFASPQTGEITRMTLRSEGFSEGLALGEVVRQNGESISVQCQIKLTYPTNKSEDQRETHITHDIALKERNPRCEGPNPPRIGCGCANGRRC